MVARGRRQCGVVRERRPRPGKDRSRIRAGLGAGGGGGHQTGSRADGPLAQLILKPESPAHGGACIAREDGKVWLVNYALPGEVVEAEPRGRQGGVAGAAATRVIEAPPPRVTPRCPYFRQCGGLPRPHPAPSPPPPSQPQRVRESECP